MSRDQSVVYYPEDLSLLGAALDEAFTSLPEDQRTHANRIELARQLLAGMAAGESDPKRLARVALLGLKPAIAPERRSETRTDRNPFAICFRYQPQTA